MTDKQSAETLRILADMRRKMPDDSADLLLADSAERGADAIEMLEWLFGVADGMLQMPISRMLYKRWVEDDTNDDFRDYCEKQWRASRGE